MSVRKVKTKKPREFILTFEGDGSYNDKNINILEKFNGQFYQMQRTSRPANYLYEIKVREVLPRRKKR